jgi:hypothetical protein
MILRSKLSMDEIGVVMKFPSQSVSVAARPAKAC